MPDTRPSEPEGIPQQGRRRRVLLVSTNYAPEHTGIGPYATQIAEHWAASGHDTHVLAGMPHYPAWSVDADYRGAWRRTEQRGGVTVHRRRHTVPARQTAVRRALFEASVLAHKMAAPPRMGRPDAVSAQRCPAWRRGGGGPAGGPVGRAVRTGRAGPDGRGGRAERYRGRRPRGGGSGPRRGYDAAARHPLVGVIHETFVDRVRALGVPAERIRVVPNWSHVAAPPRPRERPAPGSAGRPPARSSCTPGTMGLKQGLDVLVETARLDRGCGWC